MFKISKPLMFVLVGVIAVAAYLMTSPTAPTRTTKKNLPKPKVLVSSAQYTKEDYEAKFPTVALASRSAFQPLVMRKNGALLAALAASGNIPADFAGGDPNWACTGTAEVDGVRQALIENKSINDGVFLKQGDHWKNCVVSQVLEDGVVLVGPGGEAKSIQVKQDVAQALGDIDLSGNIPVQPQLNGAIGGPMGQPGGGGQITQVPALPQPQPETATIETDDSNGG